MTSFSNNDFQKKAIKAAKAKRFLDDHPALSASPLGEATRIMHWGIEQVCKRGEWKSGHHSIPITKKDKGWQRFKKEFDLEEKEIENTHDNPKDIAANKTFLCIYKSYKELYGETWKFDHVIYWYEIDFSVFSGTINTNDWGDYKCWQNYCGIKGQSLCFEDMLIHAASHVKSTFGNFSLYDKKLMSDIEINNHKQEQSFFFVDCKDLKGYSEMRDNPKHFRVFNDLLNLRWLRRFVESDYCKKNWKDEFQWIKNKNIYPYG
jgi:hypothetical protein